MAHQPNAMPTPPLLSTPSHVVLKLCPSPAPHSLVAIEATRQVERVYKLACGGGREGGCRWRQVETGEQSLGLSTKSPHDLHTSEALAEWLLTLYTPPSLLKRLYNAQVAMRHSWTTKRT